MLQTNSSILTQKLVQSSPKHINIFLTKVLAQPKYCFGSDFIPSLLYLLLDLKQKIPCSYQHNNTLQCFVLELAPFSWRSILPSSYLPVTFSPRGFHTGSQLQYFLFCQTGSKFTGWKVLLCKQVHLTRKSLYPNAFFFYVSSTLLLERNMECTILIDLEINSPKVPNCWLLEGYIRRKITPRPVCTWQWGRVWH